MARAPLSRVGSGPQALSHRQFLVASLDQLFCVLPQTSRDFNPAVLVKTTSYCWLAQCRPEASCLNQDPFGGAPVRRTLRLEVESGTPRISDCRYAACWAYATRRIEADHRPVTSSSTAYVPCPGCPSYDRPTDPQLTRSTLPTCRTDTR